jgi:outer membrane protein
MLRSFSLPALAVCASALFCSPAFAQLKVGVVNMPKALQDTAEVKKANVDLQNKFKPRQDALDKVQRELSDIQTQLQAAQGKLSAAGEAELQARGERKQREAQRLAQDLQDDVNAETTNIRTRCGQRMLDVLKKVAEEKQLDLVVEAGNTYFFKPTLDITTDATAAYDKAYPVK